MDKVKRILEFFKKYLFWFICGSTIIVVVICWWTSTKSLATSFQVQQAAIKKKISEVEGIIGDTQHPTPEYIKGANDKNQKLKEDVLEVWTTLYKEQKEKNQWPKDVLGEDFTVAVSKLGPGDQIPDYLREKYQNRITDYFPVLYKIVNLRQPADAPEGGAGGGENAGGLPRAATPNPLFRIGRILTGRAPVAATDKANWIGVVDWDDNDRQRLEDRFDWTTRPDTDLILLRQEDLWVYETLLRAISKANEGASDHSQANIKRIEWIEIGADAIRAWSIADQSVFRVQQAAESATGQGQALPDAKTALAGRDIAGQEGNEQLLMDRYVDDKGIPLGADAKHPYAEFKMMPISMKLYMDQRKISKLLAECANRAMPIEVRRVRIRPGEGEILDVGGLVSANPSNMGREMSRRSMGGRMLSKSEGRSSDENELSPYDISVEIQGIIYIYNPPDFNTLGTGTAAEKPAEAAPAVEGGAGAPAAATGAAP